MIWQQQHGWPQLTVAGNIAGSAEGGRAGFMPFQLVMVSPVLVPVWVAGLLAPFRRAALRALRFLPLTYVALAVLYIAGNGKAYYLASLYPVLLGLGALPAADWTLAHARARRVLVGGDRRLSAAVSALIALPLLPETLAPGKRRDRAQPRPGRDGRLAALRRRPCRARGSRFPPPSARHTAIFTGNYGEAGAVDLLGAHTGSRAPTAATTASASGAARPPPTPTRSSSATTARRTPHRTSTAAARSPGSTTASASTTTSRAPPSHLPPDHPMDPALAAPTHYD